MLIQTQSVPCSRMGSNSRPEKSPGSITARPRRYFPAWGGAVLCAALVLLSMPALAEILATTDDFTKAEPGEHLPGGDATSLKNVNRNAFSHPSANMRFNKRLDFSVGNGFFKRVWVSAPASTKAADGLGPLYNAKSCQRCHLKDGRGHTPKGNWPDDTAVSMFLRLSIPPQTDEQRQALAENRIAVVPEPTYGGQLQDFAIQGHAAEGRMHIEYGMRVVTLADGVEVPLRVPRYSVTDLGYGPLHPDALFSPRVAPPMIGLGLLEAIDEADILAQADPDDADGDGISGKASQVWDIASGAVTLGRFGWKAGQPSLRQQSSGAFNGDIGISVPLAPLPAGDCTAAQPACIAARHGDGVKPGGFEAGDEVMDLVTFYAGNLAVPARRDVGAPQVLAGKKVFYEAGCAACHTPKYLTRSDAPPEQAGQLIWPYTDLLLHDMGEGLADGRPEGVASGREWRTPPLWGIGLTQAVNGHTELLHDGRARNILEAILWHGGEAEAAKQAVVELSTEARTALLRFLESM